jgi:hypothetical protein
MDFSPKLVAGLLGLFVLCEGSASSAATAVVNRSVDEQLALNHFSTLALAGTPPSDLEGVRPFASAVTFSGLTDAVAQSSSFQQVASANPLDSETVLDDLPSAGNTPLKQGSWRDLLAGLSLIGFLVVRRAALF